jgi:hypothetical protein
MTIRLTRGTAAVFAITILAVAVHLLAFQVEKSSPDMNTWLVVGQAASLGQDFYKVASPSVTNLPYWYPPLWALVLGGLASIVNPQSAPLLYAFVLRLLLMAGDLIAGVVLLRWFKVGLFYFTFWQLNPLVIATAQSGQFDIIPTLLILLAVVAHQNRRGSLSGLLLGLGFAFKFWPIIAIFPIIVNHGRDRFSYAWRVLASAGVTIAAICLPYLFTTQFASNIVNSWLTQGPLVRVGSRLGPIPILIALTLLLVVPGLALYWVQIELTWMLGFVTVLVLTLFALVSNTYIQYSLWPLPFLIILWAQSRSFPLGASTSLLCLLYVLQRYAQTLARSTGVNLSVSAYVFVGAYCIVLISLLSLFHNKRALERLHATPKIRL